MINDILKIIDEKAEEEIAKVRQGKEESILALEKEHEILLKEKVEEQRKRAIREAAKEIEDFEKSLQLKLNFKIQAEKVALIKEVYRKAQDKISELNNEEFKQLIKRLIGYLPKDKKGLILAGEKTAKILKSALGGGVKVEDSLKEEGFIFKSSDVEIDLRISQVALQMQETVNPELIKILFS